MRRNLTIVFSLVVVLTATTYFGLYVNNTPSDGGESYSLAEAEDAKTYINEKGEKWGPLPEGRQEYKVSSAEAYPKFVKVAIDPLKVSVGDVQKMSVVLRDTADIEEVIAIIKTDNEVITIPLERVSEKAVTEEDILNQEYFVREGKLYIASKENRHLALTDEIKSRLLSNVQVAGPFTVNAQEGYLKEFTYEGEWVVRDTHVKTYHTVFTVRNVLGEENSITMAWSDPWCGLPDIGSGNASFSSTCTLLTDTVDGVDNGNISFGGAYDILLLGNGTVLVWTPTYQINMGSGKFIINNGAEMREAYLFLRDGDTDSHSPSGKKHWGLSTSEAGSIRVASAASISDCDDDDDRAFLGQTLYFDTPTNTIGNFDFNCDGNGNDGSANPSSPSGNCENYAVGSVCPGDPIIPNEGRAGWTTAVSCGGSGTYVVDPGGCFPPSEAGALALSCDSGTQTYTCNLATKKFSENGRCDDNRGQSCTECGPSFGRTGFKTAVNCGQSNSSYVNNRGNLCCGISCTTITRKQECR